MKIKWRSISVFFTNHVLNLIQQSHRGLIPFRNAIFQYLTKLITIS